MTGKTRKAKGGDDPDAVPATDKWENRVSWITHPDLDGPRVQVLPADPDNLDGPWYIPMRTMPAADGYCPNCGQPADERDLHAPGRLDDDSNIVPVNPDLCQQREAS